MQFLYEQCIPPENKGSYAQNKKVPESPYISIYT
jgi:hypothetical protein